MANDTETKKPTERALYKYGRDNLDLTDYIYNIGTNVKSYVNSKDWNDGLKQEFMTAYNRYLSGLQDLLTNNTNRFSTDDFGGIVDNTGELSNDDNDGIDDNNSEYYYNNKGEVITTQDYNSLRKRKKKKYNTFTANREVATYLDIIGDALRKKLLEEKEKPATNGTVSNGTNNTSSKLSLFDLSRHGFVTDWARINNPAGGDFLFDPYYEKDEINEETGERNTTNRAAYLKEQIENYIDNIGDYDFSKSPFKDKDTYINRLRAAADNLSDGFNSEDVIALNLAGIGNDFIKGFFNTQIPEYSGLTAELRLKLRELALRASQPGVDSALVKPKRNAANAENTETAEGSNWGLPYEDMLKILSHINPLKSPRTEELIKAGLRKLTDGLTTLDWTRIATSAADIGSALASFGTGPGTIISGILGVGSTLGNVYADYIDPSVPAELLVKNLGYGLGMDAVGLIPGAGTAGKVSKIARTLKPVAGVIMGYLMTEGLILSYDSFGKLLKNPESLTVDDLINISNGLQAVAGLGRTGAGFLNRSRVTSNKQRVRSIMTDSGKRVVISDEDFNKLKNIKGLEELNKFFSDITGGHKLQKEFKGWHWGLNPLPSSPTHSAVRTQRTIDPENKSAYANTLRKIQRFDEWIAGRFFAKEPNPRARLNAPDPNAPDPNAPRQNTPDPNNPDPNASSSAPLAPVDPNAPRLNAPDPNATSNLNPDPNASSLLPVPPTLPSRQGSINRPTTRYDRARLRVNAFTDEVKARVKAGMSKMADDLFTDLEFDAEPEVLPTYAERLRAERYANARKRVALRLARAAKANPNATQAPTLTPAANPNARLAAPDPNAPVAPQAPITDPTTVNKPKQTKPKKSKKSEISNDEIKALLEERTLLPIKKLELDSKFAEADKTCRSIEPAINLLTHEIDILKSKKSTPQRAKLLEEKLNKLNSLKLQYDKAYAEGLEAMELTDKLLARHAEITNILDDVSKYAAARRKARKPAKPLDYLAPKKPLSGAPRDAKLGMYERLWGEENPNAPAATHTPVADPNTPNRAATLNSNRLNASESEVSNQTSTPESSRVIEPDKPKIVSEEVNKTINKKESKLRETNAKLSEAEDNLAKLNAEHVKTTTELNELELLTRLEDDASKLQQIKRDISLKKKQLAANLEKINEATTIRDLRATKKAQITKELEDLKKNPQTVENKEAQELSIPNRLNTPETESSSTLLSNSNTSESQTSSNSRSTKDDGSSTAPTLKPKRSGMRNIAAGYKKARLKLNSIISNAASKINPPKKSKMSPEELADFKEGQLVKRNYHLNSHKTWKKILDRNVKLKKKYESEEFALNQKLKNPNISTSDKINLKKDLAAVQLKIKNINVDIKNSKKTIKEDALFVIEANKNLNLRVPAPKNKIITAIQNMTNIQRKQNGGTFVRVRKFVAGGTSENNKDKKPVSIDEWYSNLYKLKNLTGWDFNKDASNAGGSITKESALHGNAEDLSTPFLKNYQYTVANPTLIGKDLLNYYNSDFKGKSIEDYVKEYNNNAAKIRGFWDKDRAYNQTGAATHNRLFKSMFGSRSSDEDLLYNIGYDPNSDDIIGSSTWLRRMDRYEKEYDALSDDEKASRMFLIDLGNGNTGYVYKKANGDIGMLDPETKLPIEIPSSDVSLATADANIALNRKKLALFGVPRTTVPKDKDNNNGKGTTNKKAGSGQEFWKNNPTLIYKLPRALYADSTNRRLTDLAKASAVPLLKDPVDIHRYTRSDLDAEMLGERNYASIRRMAMNPLTSDGNLLTASLFLAELQGQQARLAGLSKSDLVQKQYDEMAWNQEKENTLKRNEVATFNRALLWGADQNKSKFEQAYHSKLFDIWDTLAQQLEFEAKTEQKENKALTDKFALLDIKNAINYDPNGYGANLTDAELTVWNKILAGTAPSTLTTEELNTYTAAAKKVSRIENNELRSYYKIPTTKWSTVLKPETSAKSSIIDSAIKTGISTEQLKKIPVDKNGAKLAVAGIKAKTADAERFLRQIKATMEQNDKALARLSKSLYGIVKIK